jgi:hypothetical protein
MASTGAIPDGLQNSITSPNPPLNAVDKQKPLTFIQWTPYNNQLFTTAENSLVLYQAYLNSWYSVNQADVTNHSNDVRDLYVNLINEIVLNYSTLDEQRFLKNIDPNNPRDLAAAIPFFAQKVKDICLYYSTLRDDVQTATLQYNSKGSNTGTENILYNTVLKSLKAADITPYFNTLNLSLTSIQNNILIDIEDIYDLYSHYFDLSPAPQTNAIDSFSAPATAYDTNSGLRSDYFSANINNVDPFLNLDFNQSIATAILQYPFYLIETGEDFTISPSIKSTDLNLLKDNDFIQGVNTGKDTDLNLHNVTQQQSKYIGADFYYVITDSTLTSYTSGLLFTATSEFANTVNKRFPSIAAIPSQEFLKTAKQIGLFFKPDKIGLLHFTNFNFTASVDLPNLLPNTVYYFPDPTKYGNISGNTKQLSFLTPFKFFENNYFNKIDFSNQYRMGDVDTSPNYQLYRAYQSREQTLGTSNFGLSRVYDAQDYFNGTKDDIWSNPDVYTTTTGQLPIDLRTNNLLTLNKTLVQYKNDIYGNEYGLYKDSFTLKTPLTAPGVTLTNTVTSPAYNDIYTEPSNYLNIPLTGSSTTINFSVTSSPAKKSIYQMRNVDYGDFYYRNSNSTIIVPVSAALSAVFVKYNAAIQSEINTALINFDMYYDVLQLETQNYLIFEKIVFDYDLNAIDSTSKSYISLQRGPNSAFEKFATVWFNENQKQLIACQTTLLNTNSASNYKIIYPKIYAIDLNTVQSTQIYPPKKDSDLTFSYLSNYSLSGKGLELDVVEIEKPLLNYNQDTNAYTLTYLAKDTAGAFYIVCVKFSYYNKIFTLLSTTLYRPSLDVLHQNFGNPVPLTQFHTNYITGSAAGYINTIDSTFNFSYSGTNF